MELWLPGMTENGRGDANLHVLPVLRRRTSFAITDYVYMENMAVNICPSNIHVPVASATIQTLHFTKSYKGLRLPT